MLGLLDMGYGNIGLRSVKGIAFLKYEISSMLPAVNYKNSQCLVAEWLRQWVNLGVMPPLSDRQVVGSNSTAGMSRTGFFIQGRNHNCVSSL